MLPAFKLPVAVIKPPVPMLPMLAFAVALNVVANTPVVLTLPALALPVADIKPAVIKLPAFKLPVAVINPPVPMLPTLALPVELNVVANIPAGPKLPTLALPLAFNVPATLIPVDVITISFGVPPAEILIFPFAAGILILLFPFAKIPIKLPPVILPVAVIKPPVEILANVPLPVAETIPPVITLPPVILPVAVINPPVTTLPTLALPVAVKLLADITLALLILPPEPPAVEMLPAIKLPDTLSVPVIFAPVPVTTKTFALPADEILTLPFAAGILTLLLPFATLDVLIVTNDNYKDNYFLVHKNMIFEKGLCDSSYDVYRFDLDGKFLDKDDYNKSFFRNMKVMKKI
jgi:hypothetical protein